MILPAPMNYRDLVGHEKHYFIHEQYQARLDNETFDDRPFKDEFQKEVYEYARQVLDHNSFRRVLDFGCGSGFKLINYFFDCETIGVELPEFVPFLEHKYPGRQWLSTDVNLEFHADLAFNEVLGHGRGLDLIICSDVIEHFAEPNMLLDTLKLWNPRRLILSTPERDELCFGLHDGPPRNLHHVREWNYAQFDAYISSRFEIKQHFVINGTQIVDCTP